MKPILLLFLVGISSAAWAKPPTEDAMAPTMPVVAEDADTLEKVIEKHKAEDAETATTDPSASISGFNCNPTDDDAKKKLEIEKDHCAALKTSGEELSETQKDRCDQVQACVTLSEIKTTEYGDPEDLKPKPQDLAQGQLPASEGIKAELISKGDIRIGGESYIDEARAVGIEIVDPNPTNIASSAVLNPDETVPTLAVDRNPAPTTASPATLAKTEPLIPPPPAVENAAENEAAARETLDKTPTTSTDLNDLVLNGEGNYSSDFGPRSCKGCSKNHKGQDIAAANGTAIFPVAPGEVIESRRSDSYGNIVSIEHADGTVSRYAHMDDKSIMPSVGDIVDKNDTIGLVGDTGNSEGPHLHLEIRIGGINGTAIDPLGSQATQLISSLSGISLTEAQIASFESSTSQQTVGYSTGNTTTGGVNTYSTAPTPVAGGVQVGTSSLPVVFASAVGNLILGPAAPAVQTGVQATGNVVASALPVIYVTAEQLELLLKGEDPGLTTSQYAQVPTDCTDQESTLENEELLREECRETDDELEDIGSGDGAFV